MRTRRGYTLIELLVVMLLLALLLALAVPGTRSWRDRAAVRGARDELAAALGWTRIAAVTSGGAALVVDPATGRFWTRAADADEPPVDLRRRFGVEVDVGSGGAIELYYDALGIGRIASRRIVLRRGEAEAGLTVSSYGRFRRW